MTTKIDWRYERLPREQVFMVSACPDTGAWVAEGYPADIVVQAPTLKDLGQRLEAACAVENMETAKREAEIPRRPDKPGWAP